jgi:hypothetical protein
MHHIIGSLVIGMVAGSAAKGGKFRPALRGIVKQGLRAKRKLESAGSSLRVETQKLVDEAREELNRDAMEQHS